MRFAQLTILSATALALAACGQKSATSDAGSNVTTSDSGNMMTADAGNGTAPAVSGGQAFANAAAASDAFEIATSKLALTTSSSSAIKTFAQSMIDAHAASTAKLETAASGAIPAITPDPTLTAEQQGKLDAMKGMTGQAFDAAYVAGQTEGHQKTLDTLRAYSSSGDVPGLKAFATDLAPTVAAHLNMAKALKA